MALTHVGVRTFNLLNCEPLLIVTSLSDLFQLMDTLSHRLNSSILLFCYFLRIVTENGESLFAKVRPERQRASSRVNPIKIKKNKKLLKDFFDELLFQKTAQYYISLNLNQSYGRLDNKTNIETK